MTEAKRAASIAMTTLKNEWLIEELAPYATPTNFFGKIIHKLETGTLASSFSGQVSYIIADTLAREVAPNGDAYHARKQVVLDGIFATR